MNHQSSTALRQRPGAIAEVIAISIIWPCALVTFGAGFLTQNTELALQGLAMFLATYFYTLVRLYQIGSPDTYKESSLPITPGQIVMS
jgi:hypothetical protein